MKIAANMHRAADLVEAPSIRAALELLSDKEPDAVVVQNLMGTKERFFPNLELPTILLR